MGGVPHLKSDRLGDLWSVSGGPFAGLGPVPSARDRRAGSRERKRAELMTVLETDQKGLTWREIAVLLWGAERVAEDWWPGGWMRGRVKRRIAKARAMLKAYRDFAAGWR